MNSKKTVQLDDEATAAALREAGLGVSEGMTDAEAKRAYALQANVAMRKVMFENEKRLKGLQVDWIFSKLNLVKYR